MEIGNVNRTADGSQSTEVDITRDGEVYLAASDRGYSQGTGVTVVLIVDPTYARALAAQLTEAAEQAENRAADQRARTELKERTA